MKNNLILSCSILLVFAGCSDKTPPELQGLYPVSITVQEAGRPIEGTVVTLSAKTPIEGLWASNGVTNEKGVAIIQTKIRTHKGPGAKPGTYAVQLVKIVEMPSELIDYSDESRALAKKQRDYAEKNRAIPKEFEKAETTPVEIVVKEGEGASIVVDIDRY